MRKVFFMVFIMTALSLSAQEIVINSFKEKPHYELENSEIKKDGNGEICALINVYFEEKKASFEGSYVVDSKAMDRFYRVYLAGGAAKMTIKHNDYCPISVVFADYGIKKLEPNKVYELSLMSDKTANAIDKDFVSEDIESKANSGDAIAQYQLGKSFYLGLNDEQDYEKAISWFNKSAKQGNIDATYNLGLCYLNGQGVEQNHNTAINYLKEAALNGHAMAQFKYAYCLHLGLGKQGKNIDEAIKWYENAAAQKVVKAKNNVATIYLFNDPTNYLMGTSDVQTIGFPQHYGKAIKYLKECEDANMPEAFYNLGNAYSDGIGVKKDGKKAIEYYQKAVKKGLYSCNNAIGVCYANGLGVNQDDKKAIEYFELAAQKGVADAYYNLALCYQMGKGTKQNIKKAIDCYQKAADLDYAVAEINLGNFYRDGVGVKTDLKKAYDLFIEGAEHGDPNGYTNIGVMYQMGIYVNHDIEKAIEYYKKAADKGNYSGLINLATIYQTGNGVAIDAYKAVEYYERACRIDHNGMAYYNLATVYHQGCGVIQKNYQKAFELYQKSVELNYAPAQYNLGIMYINGESVKKNRKVGMSYIKKAAKQDYPLAVEFMNNNKKANVLDILNTISNSISVTAN